MHLLADSTKTDKPMTLKEMVVVYNTLAKASGQPEVKTFGSKALATKRIAKLEAETKPAVPSKPTKEAKPAKPAKKATKKVAKKAEKVEPKTSGRKSTKRFTFGKHVTAAEVKSMITKTFGDLLVVSKVEFVDQHYWYCNLKLKGTKITAKKVRVDYLVNYLRIPRAFKAERKAILEQAQTGK